MGGVRDDANTVSESPTDLSQSPLIIDTDLGGDADDALALAVAARCAARLRLVVTSDETGAEAGFGQRARFARYLLDTLERRDVATCAGVSAGATRYYSVEGLIPKSVPAQADSVLDHVKAVCTATPGPVRWVGMGPLSNLVRVLEKAPSLARQLRVTQMGGALNYRDPNLAEHNIRLDIPAAHAVMAGIVDGRLHQPVFVTSDVTFTPAIEITTDSEMYRALTAATESSWARILVAHLDQWFERFYPGTIQHDALTLATAFGLPFVESEHTRVELDEIGRMTSSVTGGTLLRMSRSADYPAFMKWLGRQLDPSLTMQH